MNVGSNNRLNFASQYKQRNGIVNSSNHLTFKAITVTPGWQKQLNKLDMPESTRRGILGGIVLLIKPTADFISNLDKDEKTRWVSCLKIVDKIIIGSISGYTARLIGEKVADNLINKRKLIDTVRDGLPQGGKGVAKTLAYLTAYFTMFAFDIPVMSRVIQATTNWIERGIKTNPKDAITSKKTGVN